MTAAMCSQPAAKSQVNPSTQTFIATSRLKHDTLDEQVIATDIDLLPAMVAAAISSIGFP